jgi:hypothetical protein
MKYIFYHVILPVLFVLGAILIVVLCDNNHRKACEVRGGEYYSGRGAHLCIKPGAIIHE